MNTFGDCWTSFFALMPVLRELLFFKLFDTAHLDKYLHNTEDLGLFLMLHPQRYAKMCDVYSHFKTHSPLKLYKMSITVLCMCIKYG